MKSPNFQNLQNKRILAVHGFTGEPYDFAALYESDRVLADWRFVSLPGHFREMKCEPSGAVGWKLFADRISEIVDEAKKDGVELVGLGYSMGARLLLRAQLEHRWSFTRLVLLGFNPGIEREAERQERVVSDQKWATLLSQQGIDGFVESWMAQPIIVTQNEGRSPGLESREGRILRKKLLQPEPLAAALMDYSNGKLEPIWNRLCEVEIPVSLVTGERDLKFREIHQQAQTRFPNATVEVIPNAGHAPHLEIAEDFIAWLVRLFSS